MLRVLLLFFCGAFLLTDTYCSFESTLVPGITASVIMSFCVPSGFFESDKPWRPCIISEAVFLILEFVWYKFAADAILYS